MNPSPEILNELKAISPLLARLEKINVFRVPAGYFDELHLRIAEYTLLNNKPAEDYVNKKNVQEVPAGYFETLSDSILAKVKASYPESAEEELRGLSAILSNTKANVFSVPDGYFELLSDSILAKVKASYPESAEEELRILSPILSNIKGNVFSVPDGYFELFAGNVVSRLNRENANPESAEKELRELSPLLYALQSEHVFSVPHGYFESLAEDIAGKLKPKPAKVISMKRRNSWLRYAAAAVITGVIGVSSLQIFNANTGNSVVSGLPDYVKAAYEYKTEKDLNAGIAKLSDDDIIKFLEKNGNVMDDELLTNNTDVSEMPSQADYLTDENTLNTYLDKIDAESADKSKP